MISNFPNEKGKITLFIKNDVSTSSCGRIDENGKYFIIVKEEKEIRRMEYSFLHELVHCLQMENGIIGIKETKKEYNSLAVIINSIILDIDVTNKLNQVGIFFDDCWIKEDTQDLLDKIKEVSRNDAKFVAEYFKFEVYFLIIAKLLFCELFYNTELLNESLKYCKNQNIELFEMYRYVNGIIKNRDLNNQRDVHTIFRYILKKFSLYEYVLLP